MERQLTMGWKQLKTLTITISAAGGLTQPITIPNVGDYRKYVIAVRGIEGCTIHDSSGDLTSATITYGNGVRVFGPFSSSEQLEIEGFTLGSFDVFVTPFVSDSGELDELPIHPLPVANAAEFQAIQVVTDTPNDGDAYIYSAADNIWAPGPVGGEVRDLLHWTMLDAQDPATLYGGVVAMPQILSRGSMTIAAFDPDVTEGASFFGVIPYDWDGRNVDIRLHWTCAPGAGAYDVVWVVSHRVYACGESDIDSATAIGAVQLTATGNNQSGILTCSIYSDYVILPDGGTDPAGGDYVGFLVYRYAEDGDDTCDVDAHLVAVSIQTH